MFKRVGTLIACAILAGCGVSEEPNTGGRGAEETPSTIPVEIDGSPTELEVMHFEGEDVQMYGATLALTLDSYDDYTKEQLFNFGVEACMSFSTDATRDETETALVEEFDLTEQEALVISMAASETLCGEYNVLYDEED